MAQALPLSTTPAPRRWTWQRIVAWIVLVVTTIIALFPMYWLFISTLTPTQSTINTTPQLWPANPSFANFQRLFQLADNYWRWVVNSLFVALAVTGFHMFFDTMAGYAFAKRRVPGRTFFF